MYDLLGEIAINKTTLSDVYNIYYADFLDTFNKIGIPSYLPNAFFIDGGTLAVENALKAAFDWKRRINIEKNIKSKGDKVIFFKLRDEFGQTFVIVTHNEELANMADRKLTMVDGKIVN